MKKIKYKILLVTCIVTLFPIAVGLVFYDSLPNEIAVHFNIKNNPDNYLSKQLFIFGMPVLMMVLHAICCVITDITDKYPEANRKMNVVCKLIFPILSNVLYVVTIMYAVGNKLDIRKIVMFILGILFVVMGNYLPKTKGEINLLKKVSEDEYKKIARISGYLLIFGGLLCLISNFFSVYVSVLTIALIIIETIGLCLYMHFKRKN